MTLENVELHLEKESKVKEELESRCREIELKSADANKKAQQLINGLKQQLDEQSKTKVLRSYSILRFFTSF